MLFEKLPSAIIKGNDWNKSEEPIGPKFLKYKGTSKNNGLSIGPVNKTVEWKPQGKPPKGKYALIKSKTASAANNT